MSRLPTCFSSRSWYPRGATSSSSLDADLKEVGWCEILSGAACLLDAPAAGVFDGPAGCFLVFAVTSSFHFCRNFSSSASVEAILQHCRARFAKYVINADQQGRGNDEREQGQNPSSCIQGSRQHAPTKCHNTSGFKKIGDVLVLCISRVLMRGVSWKLGFSRRHVC